MSIDPVGTVYVQPGDDCLWRIVRYEKDAVQELRADDPADVPTIAVYDRFSTNGAARVGGPLPEDAVRVYIPTPEHPPRHALFVDPDTGDAYRHGGWQVDLREEPFTGTKMRASQHAVHLAHGSSSSRTEIPERAVLVWLPEPEVDRFPVREGHAPVVLS